MEETSIFGVYWSDGNTLEVNSHNGGGCFNMVKMMNFGLYKLQLNFLFLPFKIIRCFASG